MKTFRVVCKVTEDKLDTVLDVLRPEVTSLHYDDVADLARAKAAAANLSVSPVPAQPAMPPRQPVQLSLDDRAVAIAGLQKSRAITAILKGLRSAGTQLGTVIPYAKLEPLLLEAGYSPTSLSPMLSKLQKAGMSERVGHTAVRFFKLEIPA